MEKLGSPGGGGGGGGEGAGGGDDPSQLLVVVPARGGRGVKASCNPTCLLTSHF